MQDYLQAEGIKILGSSEIREPGRAHWPAATTGSGYIAKGRMGLLYRPPGAIGSPLPHFKTVKFRNDVILFGK
jgi:hypothetical protein